MGIKTRNAPPCFGPIAHLIARAETVCKPDDQKYKRIKKGRKKFSPEINEQMRQDRLSGMTLKETADKWGCSIAYLTQNVAVQVYKKGRKFSPEEEAQIYADKAGGMTNRETAKKWGCSIPYVAKLSARIRGQK